MLAERKKPAPLAVLAGVAVLAVLAPVLLSIRHYEACTESVRASGPVLARTRNVFIAVGCLISLTAAGIVYHRANKKKSRMENFVALDKINEELQFISAERTRTAIELEEHSRLLKTIITAVPQGIFWKDANSVYQGCNSNYARLIGLERPESVIGKTDFEIETNREKGDFYVKCDREVMKTGIPLLNMEETCCSADGTETNLLTSKVPLRDSDGKINGVTGICADVTELKKAQNETGAEGSMFFDAVSAMQVGLVLTDPSGNIIGVNACFAELLAKPADQLRGRNICDCMSRPAGEQLRNIIETLGQSASGEPAVIQHRIGREDFQIKVQPLYRQQRYDGTVINVIDVSTPTKAKEQAQLASLRKTRFLASMSRQIRTPLNNITGFAELLKQEELTGEQARFVKMIAASAENILTVVAEIIDLAEEEVDDPGEQDATAHTTESDSPVPGDCEPNNEIPESALPAPGPVDGNDDEQHSILIVDDVLENRMLLDAFLKKAGYRLSFASNGYEAVELTDSIKFDVILMDIQMAGMNGLEATRTIRQHSLNAGTPILAMTASATDEDKNLCFDTGCDDFIRKPVKKELVMRKIRRFIQHQEQIKEAGRGGEITSFLAGDPDYQKTIATFIGNLPARIREMRQAFDEGNLQELAFMAHALKGIGGFAGFPIYTEMAKSIEKSVKETQLDAIQQKLDEMVSLCRRTNLTQQ